MIREQWGMKGLVMILEQLGMKQLLKQLLQRFGIKHHEQWDMHCETTYSPSNSKDYPSHAKIAKECRKQNEEIYTTVMVGMV